MLIRCDKHKRINVVLFRDSVNKARLVWCLRRRAGIPAESEDNRTYTDSPVLSLTPPLCISFYDSRKTQRCAISPCITDWQRSVNFRFRTQFCSLSELTKAVKTNGARVGVNVDARQPSHIIYVFSFACQEKVGRRLLSLLRDFRWINSALAFVYTGCLICHVTGVSHFTRSIGFIGLLHKAPTFIENILLPLYSNIV